MWDKQGVLRGACGCGDCVEFMTGSDVSYRCEYCDCVPTKHKRIEGDVEIGKDYSLETYNTFPLPPAFVSRNNMVLRKSILTSKANSVKIKNCKFHLTDTNLHLPIPEANMSLSPIQSPTSSQNDNELEDSDAGSLHVTCEQMNGDNGARFNCEVKLECESDTSCYSLNDLPIKTNLETVKRIDHDAQNKTVACSFCPKMFKFVQSRNRHLKKRHPSLVYVCSVCKKLFVAENEFIDHFSSKHPKVDSDNKPRVDVDDELVNIPLHLNGECSNSSSKDFNIKDEPLDPDINTIRISLTDGFIKVKDSSSVVVTDNPMMPAIRKRLKEVKTKSRATRKRKKRPAVVRNQMESNKGQITEDSGITIESEDILSNGKAIKQSEGESGSRRLLKLSPNDLDCNVPVKCDFCDTMFTSQIKKRKHERAVHSPLEFTCQYCGKVYKRMYDLEDHERAHTGYRPFKCSLCEKAFTSKHNLRNHQNLHNTRGAFICMYCGKDFDSKSGMEYHELTHTGIRPQTCTICNKTFKHKSALITHQRIHTDEKPYPCKYCSKSFRDSSTLRKHVRIHTLEKPYKCGQCEKAYNQRWCLRTHYVKSHPGVPIPVINAKYPMTL